MTVVVVDGANLEQVKADAGYEEPEPKVKTETKPAEKGEKPDAVVEDDADDVEDEEGVTLRQKRELSAKMLKAIGKKHRQVKEAEEFAAHQIREKTAAEKRTAELEEEVARLTPRQQAQAQVEPKRENFATETEFIDARVKWGVDLGIQQREAQRTAEIRQASVRDQYAKASELVPDFEATVNKQVNYPVAVAQYMRESDMFAELGYHFAKDPKALEKLASLTPVRQLVELGKIEGTLQPFGKVKANPEAPTGDKPKAPEASVDTGFSPSKARSDAPVIKPLTGGEGSVEPDVRSMNIRQNIEQFQKTKGVNLHARKRH